MPKNQGLSLNEVAFRKINELIVSLKLRPGSLVDERNLEAKLKIGRTPIREALFRLAAEGLVEAVPNRGFFVKSVTLEDVRALFEAMTLLERNCAFLAARRAGQSHIDHLEELHAMLQEAMHEEDYLQVTLLNSRFHRVLYDSTGNQFLASALHHLQSQAQRLAFLSYSRRMAQDDLQAHFRRVTQDHQALIRLIRERNQRELVGTITEHVKLFHSRVIRYLSPPAEELDILLQGPGLYDTVGGDFLKNNAPVGAGETNKWKKGSG
jgi:GntR family transcriptional regulator, rspAB operon transcriptional repressor